MVEDVNNDNNRCTKLCWVIQLCSTCEF